MVVETAQTKFTWIGRNQESDSCRRKIDSGNALGMTTAAMEEATAGQVTSTRDGSLLQELPEDVLALISSRISPKDVINLSATCRGLWTACDADRIWLPHWQQIDSGIDFSSWRTEMNSCRALYRFMASVLSLLGSWVQQNPERGNLVYVTWGFVSVVGVRIIQQEVGPLGVHGGLLWIPVFEIAGNPDGSSVFLLHGRKSDEDFCCCGRFYPSSLQPNVLLLGAEVLAKDNLSGDSETLRSLIREDLAGEECSSSEVSRNLETKGKGVISSEEELLELATNNVALQVPALLTNGVLIPTSRRSNLSQKAVLPQGENDPPARRRLQLWHLQKYRNVTESIQENTESVSVAASEGVSSELLLESLAKEADDTLQGFQDRKQGENVGIVLQAEKRDLDFRRNSPFWPSMQYDQAFALYKIPEQEPKKGADYAGLWAGTFCWPPGKYEAETRQQPLFFVQLSYAERNQGRLLIGTKVQEGTIFAIRPSGFPISSGHGQVMFTARVEEFSSQPFPFQTERDGLPVRVVEVFQGQGGYQGSKYLRYFRGSEPGDLFVLSSGVLAFVWGERDFSGEIIVLSLERLDLRQCVANGERLPASPPLANFGYLSRGFEKAPLKSSDQGDLQSKKVRRFVGNGLGVKAISS